MINAELNLLLVLKITNLPSIIDITSLRLPINKTIKDEMLKTNAIRPKKLKIVPMDCIASAVQYF